MRSALVTGVSRGLGAAFFDEFHAAGDRVLALGRRFTDAQYAAAFAEPDRIRLRLTDLADPASLPDATELAAFLDTSEPGEVVLVHNAADFEPFGPIGALSPDEVETAVAVNLTAPMLLTNALFARAPIPAHGAGVGLSGRTVTVLFISSSAAHRVSGGRAVYGSTKRAGEMFFASLNDERGPDANVRVVIIDPGIMDTEMQANVRKHARQDVYFPDRERFINRYDGGELPSPVEVARKVIAEHLG
jgi:NAD(P)-dependent dehydrogenase (short-subunit alcohol dehydrogenase family)